MRLQEAIEKLALWKPDYTEKDIKRLRILFYITGGRGLVEMKKATIRIKEAGLLKPFLHPHLVWLVDDLLTWWPGFFVITSMWRKKKPGESGIHETSPLRAIDVRSHDFPDAVAKQIEERINAEWIYDPERPAMKVCLWHDAGSGKHFHIQVHPRTRRRISNAG